MDTFVFTSTAGTETTRLGCCSCRTYTSTRLPCKHLLCVRRLRGVAFDDSVFDSRWKCADYITHCQLNLANGSGDTDDTESVLDTKSNTEDGEDLSGDGGGVHGRSKIESRGVEQAEKYRKARHMTDQLAVLCAKPRSMPAFASRLQLLQRLYESWSKGVEVSLIKHETVVEDTEPVQKRKRGRPTKLGDGYTPPMKQQKRLRSVGRPKGSTNQLRYYQSGAGTNEDNDETSEAVLDGDVEAIDENVDAMLLAMAADVDDDNDDTYLSAQADADEDEIPGSKPAVSTSVEADDDESEALGSNIVDISDCIAAGKDGTSYVIVPENSGLLADVVGSRLELRPLDATTDIRMPLPRKRGRPPKKLH